MSPGPLFEENLSTNTRIKLVAYHGK